MENEAETAADYKIRPQAPIDSIGSGWLGWQIHDGDVPPVIPYGRWRTVLVCIGAVPSSIARISGDYGQTGYWFMGGWVIRIVDVTPSSEIDLLLAFCSPFHRGHTSVSRACVECATTLSASDRSIVIVRYHHKLHSRLSSLWMNDGQTNVLTFYRVSRLLCSIINDVLEWVSLLK